MSLDNHSENLSDEDFCRACRLDKDSMTTTSNNSNDKDVGSSISGENVDNGGRSVIKLGSVAKAVTVTFIADRQGTIRFQKDGRNGKLVFRISKYRISKHNHINFVHVK